MDSKTKSTFPSTSKLLMIIILAGFARQGILIKDPTVWLDGAKTSLSTFASI
jgi:hypothetical protein